MWLYRECQADLNDEMDEFDRDAAEIKLQQDDARKLTTEYGKYISKESRPINFSSQAWSEYIANAPADLVFSSQEAFAAYGAHPLSYIWNNFDNTQRNKYADIPATG